VASQARRWGEFLGGAEEDVDAMDINGAPDPEVGEPPPI